MSRSSFMILMLNCDSRLHSMKCTSLSGMQRELPQQGDFCTICELKWTMSVLVLMSSGPVWSSLSKQSDFSLQVYKLSRSAYCMARDQCHHSCPAQWLSGQTCTVSARWEDMSALSIYRPFIQYISKYHFVFWHRLEICLYVFPPGLFETLPGRVQCEMLLKATEQCFNTLEKAEMLLLLLKRFPESVVQHGVCNDNITLVRSLLNLE